MLYSINRERSFRQIEEEMAQERGSGREWKEGGRERIESVGGGRGPEEKTGASVGGGRR